MCAELAQLGSTPSLALRLASIATVATRHLGRVTALPAALDTKRIFSKQGATLAPPVAFQSEGRQNAHRALSARTALIVRRVVPPVAPVLT
jgi:hypothetical protein